MGQVHPFRSLCHGAAGTAAGDPMSLAPAGAGGETIVGRCRVAGDDHPGKAQVVLVSWNPPLGPVTSPS